MSEQIVTDRLVLEPLPRETAAAVVDGGPDGLRRGEGWPHADTLDAFRMVAQHGSEAWLILEDGVVVGDAGTHGPPDETGDIEIGYGLAEPVRGRGLATEFVPALAQHLLRRPDVRRVVARDVLADNVPSRRALERAGFVLEREQDGLAWYALEPVGEQPDLAVALEAEPGENRRGHAAGLDDEKRRAAARRMLPAGVHEGAVDPTAARGG